MFNSYYWNQWMFIKQFKEENVGRIIVLQEGKPIGILTHSDIIRVFPSL